MRAIGSMTQAKRNQVPVNSNECISRILLIYRQVAVIT